MGFANGFSTLRKIWNTDRACLQSPPAMKPQAAPSSSTSASPAQGCTLVQFTTPDTLANLLPALALRPARILHVRSSEEGDDHFKMALRAATQEPGLKTWLPKVQDVSLPKGGAELPDTRDLVARALIENAGAIVNFTGGTKLMSLGAFLAASALGRPSFYCDTATNRCIDGRTARFDKWPDLREAGAGMGMRLFMALAGKNLDDWRDEPVPAAARAFAIKAFELRTRHWQALEQMSKAVRTWYFGTGERAPQNTDELRALLAKPVTGPALASDAAKQYLAAASATNLLRADASGLRLTVSPERHAVENAVRMLLSSWLDLAVLDCVERNPRFKETRWNLSSASQQGAGDGGILCVDQKQRALRHITCLVTLVNSPQEHIDSARARAARLGAAACTVVLFKPQPGQENIIRDTARRAGMDVAIEADEIVKMFAPGA